MTGNTQYSLQNLIDQGHIPNRLVTYQPEDVSKYTSQYKTIYPELSTVLGPHDPQQFNLNEKITLKSVELILPDACVDSSAYRLTTFRGKRRIHAFHLAAEYRGKPLHFYENWFDESTQASLSDLLDQVQAFCHGVRVTFKDQASIWYQVNHEYWSKVQAKLSEIRNRTMQLLPDRKEDVPAIPTFAYTTRAQYPDVINAFYTSNDWEILAATYRKEIETFVQTCIYLGYDYQHYKETLQDPQELPDSEFEEDYLPPPTISPSVRKLLEDSMNRIVAAELKQQEGTHSKPSPPQNTTVDEIYPSSPIRKEEQAILPAPIEPELRLPTPSGSPKPHMESEVPNIIPSFREEQVKRVYGAAPTLPELKTGTGTERFN